jgi:hypothetical protein
MVTSFAFMWSSIPVAVSAPGAHVTRVPCIGESSHMVPTNGLRVTGNMRLGWKCRRGT